MKILVIGNAVALVGAILMVCIGLVKKRRNILIVQCAQYGVYGISNLILGGVTGAVSNGLSILRNLFCLKRELTLPLSLGFIAVQIGITVFVNTQGLVGWLPVAATVAFTACINSRDEVVLKLVIIFGQLCWAVYDWFIASYVSFAFDLFAVGSNLVGIYAIRAGRKKAKETEKTE